jgi:hypothetical protein
MPNLVVCGFEPAHYVQALRDCGQAPDPREWEHGRLYASHGPAYTIRHGGRIAAVLGVLIAWEGHGDCWAVLTPLGFQHGAMVHRATIRYLRRIIRDHELRRLQADVVADHEAGRRWMEHLGFHLEGLMPHFGPHDETFARYAWFHPRLTRAPGPLPDAVIRGGVMTDDGRFIRAISGGYDGGASIYVMIALTVAAAAASAYATYSSSQAQEQAMKYNAKNAETEAEMAKQQQAFAAQQQAERDRRTRAAARAIQGTSNVEVGEGSSLLTDLDSAKQAELNYQAIRYQGESRVRALTAEATLDRFQGRVAGQQGMLGAGTTLLGGLASAGSQYGRAGGFRSSTPKTITVPSASLYENG